MVKNPLVRAAMEKQGLTAKNQLAKRLGIDRQVITNWEKRSLPDCINTLKMLSMSGKSADEMLREIESEKGFIDLGLLLLMSLTAVTLTIFGTEIIGLFASIVGFIHYAKYITCRRRRTTIITGFQTPLKRN